MPRPAKFYFHRAPSSGQELECAVEAHADDSCTPDANQDIGRLDHTDQLRCLYLAHFDVLLEETCVKLEAQFLATKSVFDCVVGVKLLRSIITLSSRAPGSARARVRDWAPTRSRAFSLGAQHFLYQLSTLRIRRRIGLEKV